MKPGCLILFTEQSGEAQDGMLRCLAVKIASNTMQATCSSVYSISQDRFSSLEMITLPREGRREKNYNEVHM